MFVGFRPGAHYTSDSSFVLKLARNLISLPHKFQWSYCYHILGLEWNQISIEFELRWTNSERNGPHSHVLLKSRDAWKILGPMLAPWTLLSGGLMAVLCRFNETDSSSIIMSLSHVPCLDMCVNATRRHIWYDSERAARTGTWSTTTSSHWSGLLALTINSDYDMGG